MCFVDGMDDYDKAIKFLRKARDNYKKEFPLWVKESGIDYSTVFRWLDRGQLPSVRCLRVVRDVVKAKLAEKKSAKPCA